MKHWTRHFGGWLLVLVAGIGVVAVVPAQRLMVVSQTRNILGEASRLQLHSVDLDLGTAQPAPLPLSGTELAAPLLLDLQQAGAIVSSGPPAEAARAESRARRAALASFRVAPLAPWPDADNQTAPGWREWPVDVAVDQRTLSNLLVTARLQFAGVAGWRGALAGRPWPPEGLPRRVPPRPVVMTLPVGPRFVRPMGIMRYLIMGTAGAETGVSLVVADLASRTTSGPVRFEGAGHQTGLDKLRGVLVDPDQGHAWILYSALALGDGGTEPKSWLYCVDLESLRPASPPVVLPGVGAADQKPLVLTPAGHCLVTTRVPGTDFGHLVRVGGDPSGAAVVEKFSLVGVHERLWALPRDSGDDLAVCLDRRVEYWPDGRRTGHGATFDAPVEAARWTDAGLVVAEGNRVHRLALPACSPTATVSLQAGWAIGLLEVPVAALPAPDSDGDGVTDHAELRMQTRPDHPDSDGDGIPDGRDPHPNAPSPRLEAPADIVFPYAAVGRELRVLPIESLGAPDARWQIHFDSEALPWLRIHPRQSRGSGYAYLGVDPERFDPAGVVAGTLTVTLTGPRKGNRPGYRAAGSPATVQVRVASPRDPLPTILWIWPDMMESDGPSPPYRRLRTLLAGPPYYVSHIDRYGPVSEELAPYSIIVLGAEAAAEGVLTQKAMRDYLNEGGALLFLGDRLEGDRFRNLSEWFSPLDIQVDMERAVNARFKATSTAALLRHWNNFQLKDGCLFVDRRAETSVARISLDRPEEVVFTARFHGYGRIVLMAAAGPLQDEALAGDQNKSFALDLFYWLSRAGHDVSDRDGDGLLDGVEDRNQNGAVDSEAGALAETNWLDPDTDGDGIPDGQEDLNRNGTVDPGETDPRLPDTDGDGTFDGADTTPAGQAAE